jgi:rubrerythrin
VKKPFESIEEFYAHALAIEREAAERYLEFAKHFESRGEEVVAGLCANLARMEQEHFEELAQACSHLKLPALDRGGYCWFESEAPETPARELMYRVASTRQLLQIALEAERRAHEFFVEVARGTHTKGLRELASLFAAEEKEHIRLVRKAIEYNTSGNADWETLLEQGFGPGTVTPS